MNNLSKSLINKYSKINTDFNKLRSSQFYTSETVRFIIKELIDTKYNTILDPVCGIGTLLVDAYQQLPKKTYYGADISKSAIDFALMFSKENKLSIKYFLTNILKMDIAIPAADLIIADPPMGLKINKETADLYDIKSNDSTTVFLQRFLELTNDGGRIILLVPEGFLFNRGNSYIQIRNLISKKYHLSAVINLPKGALLPTTGIACSILVIDKNHSKKPVFFTKFEEIKDRKYMGDVIQAFRENNNKVSKKYFWVKNSKIDDIWSYNFYDPVLEEETKKLRQEKTINLSDLVLIIKPKKSSSKIKGRVIKTKNFNYPINEKEIPTEFITDTKLKPGDILISESFSGETKYLLINRSDIKNLYASTFLTVLRPKSKTINPEYLFLYLQSKVVKKYLAIYQVGVYFPRLRKKDLENLPVIVPDKNTLIRSKSLFDINFSIDRRKSIQDINRELFDKTKPSKPIQKELLLEELEELKIWKKEIIEKVLKEDLKELNLSKNNKLYKSFLILAGSLLEAYLLDWISEIENKDYFSSNENQLTLGNLIWKKLKKSVPDIDKRLLEKADKIRLKRNLIHPREYFNYELEIDDNTCEEIINDLNYIFKNR